MNYLQAPTKKEQERILKLFLHKPKLTFTQIEKALNLRSNMTAYHLQRMQQHHLLEKEGQHYHLTPAAESYLPLFSNITGKELSPLPIILIAILKNNQILLMQRERRPYKGYWGLIGGKMRIGETFEEASLRKLKEKTGLEGTFTSMNAVLHERVHTADKAKHAFILFFTKVQPLPGSFQETEHGKLDWFSVGNLDTYNIIPSDLWLIKNKLNAQTDITEASMTDTEGELSAFKITP